MCNMDCLHCIKADCEYAGITTAEIIQQNELDKEIKESRYHGRDLTVYHYNQSDKGKDRQKRYENSEKGKTRQKRYTQSYKGKARLKRYNDTEKGRAAARRNTKKQIESGKNAEYCRTYYYRKKAEMEKICKA